MNVREIVIKYSGNDELNLVLNLVQEWLELNEYDGLYCEECSCVLDDLAACGHLLCDCEAGHRIPCTCGGGCDFHIGDIGSRD